MASCSLCDEQCLASRTTTLESNALALKALSLALPYLTGGARAIVSATAYLDALGVARDVTAAEEISGFSSQDLAEQ